VGDFGQHRRLSQRIVDRNGPGHRFLHRSPGRAWSADSRSRPNRRWVDSDAYTYGDSDPNCDAHANANCNTNSDTYTGTYHGQRRRLQGAWVSYDRSLLERGDLSQHRRYRNGALVATTPNDGFHTDSTRNKGRATYIYQVCEPGTATCSNTATVSFGGG
jgi:hypothetical protein